jgi:hypothetical protein
VASNKRNNRGRNNNPEGRNQYSGGVLDIARDRPMTAALGAAAAVGAGVFLWSRRNQISDQLSNLSDQIVEWRDSMGSDDFGDSDFGSDALVTGSGGTGSSANLGTKSRRSKGKTQTEIAEEAMTLKETGAGA